MAPPLIAAFTKNRVNPAYVAARHGVDVTAERLGARTRHYVPEKPDDAAEQVALVARAIADRPDVILFVPIDETALGPSIREIERAGIPMVSWLNRPREDRGVTFVGADDVRLGAAVAEYLFRHVGGRGNVVVLEGAHGWVTSRERMEGYDATAPRFPGIRTVERRVAHYRRDLAREAMAALLAAGTPIDAVYCVNDEMALGAIAALEEHGRRLPLTGINAIPEAIGALRAGTLLATGDFDTLGMGCLAAEAALRHLRGERVPRRIVLPTTIVDAGNCANWDCPIEARRQPVWERIAGTA